MSTVEERVALGAEWLDNNGPEEWWNLVDLDRLWMEDTCSCVLGQLFSPAHFNYEGELSDDERWIIVDGFSFATHRFHMELRDQIGYGFEAQAVDGGFGSPYEEYQALGLAWNTLVQQRRDA